MQPGNGQPSPFFPIAQPPEQFSQKSRMLSLAVRDLGDLRCVKFCPGTQMASHAAAPCSPSAVMEAFFSLQSHEIIGGGQGGGRCLFSAERTDSFKGLLRSLLGQNQITDVVLCLPDGLCFLGGGGCGGFSF